MKLLQCKKENDKDILIYRHNKNIIIVNVKINKIINVYVNNELNNEYLINNSLLDIVKNRIKRINTIKNIRKLNYNPNYNLIFKNVIRNINRVSKNK